MTSAVWGQPEERCHGAAVRSWWDAQCRPRTRARCCLRRHAQTDRRTGRGPSNAQLSGAGTPVVPPGAGGTHWVLWVERPHRERRPDLRRPCGAHRPGRRRPYSSCRRRRGAAGQHSRTVVASSPRRAGRVLDGSPVAARLIETNSAWTLHATATLDGVAVVVHVEGRAVSPRTIALVKVTDFEPFVAAQRERIENLRSQPPAPGPESWDLPPARGLGAHEKLVEMCSRVQQSKPGQRPSPPPPPPPPPQ